MTRRTRRSTSTSKSRTASTTLVSPRPHARTQPTDATVSQLAFDLGQMIEVARQQVAQAANTALTTLYWQIGHRVRNQVLDEQRAEYGGQVVAAVGRQLEARYGRGFGEKNLRRMVQFVAVFPDVEIVAALLRQLGWTHFTLLIPIQDP